MPQRTPSSGGGAGASAASSLNAYWVAGVTVAVLAQFVSNLGSILQKRSHNDEALRPAAAQRPYPQRPLWWVGMALILSGSVADFVALTLAPQSIVATLGCLTLVAQVIWAPLILGERLSARHYVATGMIIAGVVLAVAFGPHADAHFALPLLLARFATPGFGAYAAAVAAVAAGLYAAVAYVERHFDLPPKPALADYASEDARFAACDGRLGRFHRVAFGMLSGLAGAQVVLLGKFIGELAAITIAGNTATLTSPALYAIVAALALFVAAQIYFMNEGVARFQSLYVLPVFQAVWTLTSVLGGLVVFGEWADLGRSLARQVVFPLGIALTLFAVYYLMHTPALPEDRRRSACLDRLFGTTLPPPAPPTSPPQMPTTTLEERKRMQQAQYAASGGALPLPAAGKAAGDDGASDVRKRGSAGGGLGAAENDALLVGEDEGGVCEPIDWNRTCSEIWALEVAEAGPDYAARAATAAAAAAAAGPAGGSPLTAPPTAASDAQAAQPPPALPLRTPPGIAAASFPLPLVAGQMPRWGGGPLAPATGDPWGAAALPPAPGMLDEDDEEEEDGGEAAEAGAHVWSTPVPRYNA